MSKRCHSPSFLLFAGEMLPLPGARRPVLPVLWVPFSYDALRIGEEDKMKL